MQPYNISFFNMVSYLPLNWKSYLLTTCMCRQRISKHAGDNISLILYLQLLPGENVEGNIIALERFQANKAVRHVWQQRSKLLRKNFVFTNNSQMFSNIFLIFMDRQNNTRSLLYFQTKISKLRLVYIHPRFTLIS